MTARTGKSLLILNLRESLCLKKMFRRTKHREEAEKSTWKVGQLWMSWSMGKTGDGQQGYV